MKISVYSFGVLVMTFFTLSCEYNTFYEQNKAVANRAWTYQDTLEFPVHITEKQARYDIFINLRHGSGYDFSNIHVLLHQKGPQLADTAYRKDIPLAQLDGRWLGRSAGTLYEVQHLAYSDFVFPDTGWYTFGIEQNMRQNPLMDIADVGIKLVKK